MSIVLTRGRLDLTPALTKSQSLSVFLKGAANEDCRRQRISGTSTRIVKTPTDMKTRLGSRLGVRGRRPRALLSTSRAGKPAHRSS